MAESIIARCEAKGLRMTDQRRIVARIIGAAEDHPDVEALYNRASAIDPRISIATVYRTVKLFEEAGIRVPNQDDWQRLKESVQKNGIYNQNLQAVPPTGSISYINHSTSSIHPIASKVEIRKEGKIGRAYYPAPYMTNDNLDYYQDAYEIGYEKIIDTYAAATQHVDQGLSLTLFFKDTASTRDVNKAQIYAWRKGIKTLYYIRLRQMALEGTEVEGCVSCML
jgi:ribonucleoside-diphosphate reductase alpha chain